MRRIALGVQVFIIFSGFSTSVFSQHLKLISEVDQDPVADVLVYSLSDNNSATSDFQGIVDLTLFAIGDSLVVQHQSYNTQYFFYGQEVDYEVRLFEKSIKLEEVIFSVNRVKQVSQNVPHRVETISSREISFANSQTSADALKVSGEVFIQKSQLGGGSPMIRGFAANRILLNVDNIRMNNAIYRNGNLQNIISVDANSIEQMEVIFGPGSVVYGSDALGGVINIYTKSPHFNNGEKFIFDGNASLRYSSAANEKMAHFDIAGSNDSFGFLTSFSYSDYDDLQMGTHGNEGYRRLNYAVRSDGEDKMISNDDPNSQKFSGYDQFNVIQKVSWKPTASLLLNASFQYSRISDVPRYDRLIQYENDTLKYAEWYYGPQTWLQGSLGMKYVIDQGVFDELNIKVGYQQAQESRNSRDFNDPVLTAREEQVNIFSLTADLSKELGVSHTFYYGFNTAFNRVFSTGEARDISNESKTPAASRYPNNSSLNNYGLYVNYEYSNTDQLIFQFGMRFSQFKLHAVMDTTFYAFPFNDIELNNSALNGGLGMVWKPSKVSSFNVNLTNGFRSPNIDDAAKVFDSEPGNIVVPNVDLKPEYAYNLDLGFNQIFDEQAVIDVAIFGTYLDQAMVRRNYSYNGEDSVFYDGELSRVQALVNTSYAWIVGVSLNFKIAITDHLDFNTVINYTKGQDDEGYSLRHVAPLFGRTELTYHAANFKIDLFAAYNGQISSNDLAPTEQSKPHMYAKDIHGLPYSPSWATLNLKGSYQFSPYVGMNFGIENILDARYRPYSSGIVAPGRNFIIAINARF